MATVNPFDLLGDNDTEDPSQLIATQQQKIEHKKAPAFSAKPAVAVAAKLPSKPLPPAQSVREAKTESARGGRGSGRGYGHGRGRGAGTGFNRDSTNYNTSYGNKEVSGAQGATEEADARKPSERSGGYVGPRGPFQGDHRGGFNNGEAYGGERDRPRRAFERRSGTGRGNEIKREGSGRGNWGTRTDEPAQVVEEVVNEGEKSLATEIPSREEDAVADGDKEAATNEIEKEPRDKEMTLEEYEKVLEEKRKTLQALKTEERKVDLKEFEAMQQLANKKTNDDIFVKLGSEKDKRKELAEKEERTKKSVSINEFLKHVEGERYYTPGGRGRGRGRGSRGGYGGGNDMFNVEAPSIEDPGQFPTLGGK